MKSFLSNRRNIAILIIFLVLLFDQILKIWIKTTLMYGEEIRITDWFILHFTENNGMAFGLEFGGSFGKLLLSTLRLAAIIGIIWYLVKLINDGEKTPIGLIISISLILSGALGNIIDSLFYGMIFSDSFGQVAQIFPSGGGYAGFLHGKVVDMLYFPIFKGVLPGWVPIWGNEYFIFFAPVFNLADSAITIGVAMILLFQRNYFKENK